MKIATMLVLAALIVAVPASGLHAGIIWNDLDAYWELDGDLTDSVGTHDGTYSSGTPVFATGFDGTAGNALDLAGTASYVSTTFVPGTGAKSLSLFFSTNNTDFQIPAGAHSGGNRFYVAAHSEYAGSAVPGIGNGTIVPSTAESNPLPSVDYTPTGTDVSTDNAYHHLVMIENGSAGVELYYRSPSDPGHLYYAAQFGGTSGGLGHLVIGALDTGGGGVLPTSGLVDDVAMFNRALTLVEIESIYDAGSVASAIPEPGTWALLLIGVACLAVTRRRSRNR